MLKALVFSAVFAALTAVHAATPIVDLDAIDATVDPCDDFYHYACGRWIKNFQLPADRSSYNHQTSALGEETLAKLRGILVDYAQGKVTVPAKYADKLGMFYATCVDTAAIDQHSPVVVVQGFREIEALRSGADLARLTAAFHMKGAGVFFSFGPQTDLKNSRLTIAGLSQGGLSLDDRSYYVEKDPKSVEIRAKFVAHVQKMFELAGVATAQAKANANFILSFETKLALKSLPLEDMQDSTLLYHPMDLPAVRRQTPSFDWTTYFQRVGVASPGTINVATPDFFVGLAGILKAESLANLKIYLKWHFLKSSSSFLAQPFRDETFAFWSKYLQGAQAQSPRWKQCTATLQSKMSEALGEAYVNSFGDAETIRGHVATMIGQIKSALEDDFGTLTWFDPSTRAAASKKLTKVDDKVGFPEKWMNFDTLAISKTDFARNIQYSNQFAQAFEFDKIGKPVDRSLWSMPPWEQNAYYDPSANEMVFPLGSLIPPIFDLSASQGANFGSLGGGWIGHELTHGFDSDGRNFDGDGNLNEWWSAQTKAEFEKRAQCLVDQANAYQILPGLTVNGKQTLGENVADQGGTKLGYIALLKATNGNPSAPNVGSFNERQQYWVAYAQSWCTKETDERIRQLVKSDVHPPSEFRANAVLFNRPEFANDFSCKDGRRMAPKVRCSVW